MNRVAIKPDTQRCMNPKPCGLIVAKHNCQGNQTWEFDLAKLSGVSLNFCKQSKPWFSVVLLAMFYFEVKLLYCSCDLNCWQQQQNFSLAATFLTQFHFAAAVPQRGSLLRAEKKMRRHWKRPRLEAGWMYELDLNSSSSSCTAGSTCLSFTPRLKLPHKCHLIMLLKVC